MNCPKCSAKLDNQASMFWLGFIGRVAFPKYVCPTCGPLTLQDFPAELHQKMIIKRIGFGILFFALLIFVIWATLTQ